MFFFIMSKTHNDKHYFADIVCLWKPLHAFVIILFKQSHGFEYLEMHHSCISKPRKQRWSLNIHYASICWCMCIYRCNYKNPTINNWQDPFGIIKTFISRYLLLPRLLHLRMLDSYLFFCYFYSFYYRWFSSERCIVPASPSCIFSFNHQVI